jgi:acyl-CoA synthetase (AMP-forming)/AMP-acid ligase II
VIFKSPWPDVVIPDVALTPFVLGKADTDCKIVDVAIDKELGRNEDGEIWIRGPQVMKGYLNNEGATKSSIDADGFLHTGDIGHIDDNDQYFIVDQIPKSPTGKILRRILRDREKAATH